MYEKHFQELLAFLFPNEHFPEESILLFILTYANETLPEEQLDEYQKLHGIKLSKDAIMAIAIFIEILQEMRKKEDENPDVGLIDFCVNILFWTLGVESKNLERYKTLEYLLDEDRELS